MTNLWVHWRDVKTVSENFRFAHLPVGSWESVDIANSYFEVALQEHSGSLVLVNGQKLPQSQPHRSPIVTLVVPLIKPITAAVVFLHGRLWRVTIYYAGGWSDDSPGRLSRCRSEFLWQYIIMPGGKRSPRHFFEHKCDAFADNVSDTVYTIIIDPNRMARGNRSERLVPGTRTT